MSQRVKLSILVLIIAVISATSGRAIPPEIYQMLLAEPSPTAVIGTAQVARVIDGDTIELAGGQKVRYIGMDTPERGECYYREAKAANTELIEGQKVRLEQDVSTVDKYGRWLRYVYVGKVEVNLRLVEEGMATVATYPPDVAHSQELLAAQREARAQAKGLWNPKNCQQ